MQKIFNVKRILKPRNKYRIKIKDLFKINKAITILFYEFIKLKALYKKYLKII